MKEHVSGHNSARFCPLGLRFCMHLGPSKIKILTKYGALGPLNKGLNEEINFPPTNLIFSKKTKKKWFNFLSDIKSTIISNCLQ